MKPNIIRQISYGQMFVSKYLGQLQTGREGQQTRSIWIYLCPKSFEQEAAIPLPSNLHPGNSKTRFALNVILHLASKITSIFKGGLTCKVHILQEHLRDIVIFMLVEGCFIFKKHFCVSVFCILPAFYPISFSNFADEKTKSRPTSMFHQAEALTQ